MAPSKQQQQKQQDAPAARSKVAERLGSAASGCVAGAMVSVCVQPLDVLRTRMQADAAAGRLKSTAATLASVLETHGVRGLWAGSGPTVMRLSAGLAIQFLAIDSLKDFVSSRAEQRRRQQQEQSTSSSSSSKSKAKKSSSSSSSAPPSKPVLTAGEAFLVGGGARALSSALTSPLTLVKTRMEFCGAKAVSSSPSTISSSPSSSVVSLKGKSTISALATIARAEGARGLFRGIGPTVAANAPFSALYYSFYTRLRSRLSEAGAPAAASNFGAGLLAAAAATVLTQPADMVRTHMQLGLGSAAAASGVAAGGGVGGGVGATTAAATTAAAAAPAARLGPWQTLSSVVRERGPGALLAGTAPRVLKRTLQTALVWTIYEELQPALASAASAAGGAARRGVERLSSASASASPSSENGGKKSSSTTRMAAATVSVFDVR